MAVRKRKGKKKGAGTGNHHKHGGDAQVHRDKHSRINRCHSFAWSRGLWKKAAGEIARVCAVLSFIYISAAWALAYADGLRGIDIPYFISATCTTVSDKAAHTSGGGSSKQKLTRCPPSCSTAPRLALEIFPRPTS